MLSISAPPSSSSTCKVLTSIPLASPVDGALSFGVEALKRLGGHVSVDNDKSKQKHEFPEDKINIPVGVNPKNLKNYTFYDLLGFTPEWADSADVEAIKKAYHKAVLHYHPDKAPFTADDGKEDRTVFLKIQEAHAVLSNESKRRAYDSQLPFDESIPTEEKVLKALEKGPHKFFKLFDPVFKRNARFAVKKPVPELGDTETPMQQVYKFYDYWIKFESWRDFTGIGAEYNPDSAGSREEKRYMQKENEKLAIKLKKKEMNRIIELVMLAEKRDPRIAADKEKRKSEKDAHKNAKEADSKKKAEDEAAATAWMNAQEQEVLAKNSMSKADKEKLKKNQSNARNVFRKLLRASAAQGHGSGEYGVLTAADVEIICGNSDLEDLNIMNQAMGGTLASKDSTLFLIAGVDEVLTRLNVMKERQQQTADDERIIKEAKKREQEDKAKKVNPNAPPREWSKEAIAALSKSQMRYQPGFANRWSMITHYMNDQLKPDDSFTLEECLVKAHHTFLAQPPKAVSDDA